MSCKKFEKKLFDFINNDLKKGEEKQLINHLAECEECKREYIEIKTIIEESKNIKIPTFPSDWWDKNEDFIFERTKRKEIFSKRKIVLSLISIIFVFSLSSFLFITHKEKIAKKEKSSNYTFYSNVLPPQNLLPFSEEELIEMVDYMDEDQAEEILRMLLR